MGQTTLGPLYFFFFFTEIATVWPKIFYWNSYKYCDINLSDYNGFLSKSFIFLMFVSNDVTCREYLGLLCILSSSTLCECQLQLARKLLRQTGKVNGYWHSHNKGRAENNLFFHDSLQCQCTGRGAIFWIEVSWILNMKICKCKYAFWCWSQIELIIILIPQISNHL